MECILIKTQALNVQSATLIKKETPAQVFSCEFCKNFKNTFLKNSNINIATFNLLCTFHQPSLPFKEFTKVNKFGNVEKWLPSVASFYTFSLKRKKWTWKKWQWVLHNFYLKGLQSGFLLTKSLDSQELSMQYQEFSMQDWVRLALPSCV